MFNREGEEIAVRFGTDTCDSASIRQQTDFTEVRAIAETCSNLSIGHHNIDNAFLNKIHFGTDCTLFDDDVSCKTSRIQVYYVHHIMANTI